MKCKDCKHWQREMLDWPNKEPLATFGKCSVVVEIYYFNLAKHIESVIEPGKMAGDNVCTHQDFGCVNFDVK